MLRLRDKRWGEARKRFRASIHGDHEASLKERFETNRSRSRFGSMPRFYFHFYDPEMCRDDEGIELVDNTEACRRGTRHVLGMAATSIMEDARLSLSHRIVVMSEDGEQVAVLRYRDVITIED